jgi:hypothetical protein
MIEVEFVCAGLKRAGRMTWLKTESQHNTTHATQHTQLKEEAFANHTRTMIRKVAANLIHCDMILSLRQQLTVVFALCAAQAAAFANEEYCNSLNIYKPVACDVCSELSEIA